ncbi:MAG: peptidase M4 [Candidatus Binatia bacterium]
MANDSTQIPSTTEATAAQAQSHGDIAMERAPIREPNPCANLNVTYLLGPGVERLAPAPYERVRGDPVFRPLRIFTVDPSTPRLAGAIALVDVPYEPVEPGPTGKLFSVDNYDGAQKIHYRRADLDDKNVLITDGYVPSQSDPRFHQQMVYAVCSNVYATFRKALGRHLAWGLGATQGKLVIRPHAFEEANAYYDEAAGELQFGYYVAGKNSTDITLPGGFVFTCLSHDVIAHEVTHALLDGLRAEFSRPSGIDVLAFHEAFADLVAVFQRFSYKEVVRNAIRDARGDITKAEYLTKLALQFGHTTGKKAALRSAIDKNIETGAPRVYDSGLEAHELGSVLVAAVFEAFAKIYRRKTERYLRLATAGSGLLPKGELPHDLQAVLADRAAKLAGQFLSICIRAIDYCPPIGLTFGDYLRALITADYDLVADDPWDYRGALIEAFRRRNIYPRGVANISEEALLWRPTRKPLAPVKGLDFAHLRFRGDPGRAADPNELRRQACVLGDFVARPEHLEEFGLVANGDSRLEGDTVSVPSVRSIRSSRRVGPDGQIAFDVIAEVTQLCTVARGSEHFQYYGGSTIILGPMGEIRYVILKNVVVANRLERRREFLHSDAGQQYWLRTGSSYTPKTKLFKLLHGADADPTRGP